jgi:hypothetical protein
MDGPDTRRDPMTEQPTVPQRPAGDDELRSPDAGSDAEPHGKVRTEGETSVDEAMGAGDNLH